MTSHLANSAARAPIRFAYWVPNVSGGLVISKIPQRTSWDAAYNRKLAQIAEEAGFDYGLTQIRFTRVTAPSTSTNRSLSATICWPRPPSSR